MLEESEPSPDVASEFPPEKDKCKTCEHDSDSGQEYCGTCASGVESNWKEASWVKSDKIVKLEVEITRLREALSDIATGKHPQKRCVEIAGRGLTKKKEE